MNEAKAKRVALALGRKEPGLVLHRTRGDAGAKTEVFGHPLLAGYVREHPASPEVASSSLLQALDLAVRQRLPLIVIFQPETEL